MRERFNLMEFNDKSSETSSQGLRRGASIDLGRNICHGSDSPESAKHELEMWFPEGVNDYGRVNDKWVYEK